MLEFNRYRIIWGDQFMYCTSAKKARDIVEKINNSLFKGKKAQIVDLQTGELIM